MARSTNFSTSMLSILIALAVLATRVFSAEDAEPTAVFHDHQRAVLALAYSPDGVFLASGGEDKKLIIRTLRQAPPDPVKVAEWRQLIRSLDHNRFRVRQNAHETLAMLGPEIVPDLEASLKASPSSEVRRRVDRLLKRYRQPTGIGHEGAIRDLAFSPDGTVIASAGHDDSVRFWSASTGKSFHLLRAHSDGVWSLQYSADGRELFTGGGDNRIVAWDTVTYQTRLELKHHGSTVQALATSRDHHLLASAGGFDGTVGLYETGSGKTIAKFETSHDSVISLAFHPTEPILVSGGYGRFITLWNLQTLKPIADVAVDLDIVRALSFSREGKWLAVGGKGEAVQLVAWANRETQLPLPGHAGTVYAVSFAPDSDSLATGDESGTIRIWNAPQTK